MILFARVMFLLCGLTFGLTSLPGAAEISADGRILTGAGGGGGRNTAASTNPGGYGGKSGIGGGGGGGGLYNGTGNDANGGDGGIGGGGGGAANSNGGQGGGIDTMGTSEAVLSGPGGGFGGGGGGGSHSQFGGGGSGGYGDGFGGIGASGHSGGGGGYGNDTGGNGGNSSAGMFGHIGGGGGGGAGRVLTGVTSFTVSSDITAGSGGSAPLTGGGGGGGVGLVIYDMSTVTSTSTIFGGNGGDTIMGSAGQGGAGVFLVGADTSHAEVGRHAGGVFSNNGEVQGGIGGFSASGLSGSGGHGVLANNAVINNFSTGLVLGGNAGTDNAAGNNGGHGIYAHSYSPIATEITNHGLISGGNGTGTSGLGGYGIRLTGDNGKIYNNASITGGTNGDGARRAAVKIGIGDIASANNEVHMTATASFFGDVDASEATNTKLVLTGDDNGSFNMSHLVSADGTAANEFINFARLGKEGASTWTLTGTASGNQDWEISAGTLIGSTNTIKGSADIATGAALEFNQASDGKYSGSLSGNGTLVKSGSGILTLTSTGSTFTGANHITAGTLAGDTNTIKGNADIATGAALEFNQASDGTYSGSLSGNGTLVKSGSGILTLTSMGSTFTGANHITAGTLAGDTNTIKGNADIATGAALEFNQASDGTYSGSLSGNGTLVKSGSGKLTLTNTGSTFAGVNNVTAGTLSGDTNTIRGSADIATGAALEFNQASDGTYSGSLSGNGTLVKSGSGKLTFTNTNSTFIGTNTITSGTLSGDTNTIRGSADIATGAALEFNQASDGTYTGSLSGNGTLVKSGSGILTLTNTGSTFAGVNNVTAGTLSGDTNTIRGNADIATGAALEFNQASDGTYSGSLSGNGTLVKSGSGILTLTSTGSTFTGANHITAGTLAGDTNTIKGNADIATGAALEFNQASDGTYSGSLSGNGTLVKSGSGKLTLTNTGSTFAGVNNVTAGTLSGDTNTIRGSADIATGAALEFNQASDGTYSGSLSGNGTLVKSGSGKLTLTNTGNTFAGVNNVTAGTLSGDTNTIRGNADIATGAALEFNQASDGTYSGSLSGNGTLVKSGSGKLTLTNSGSTFAGVNNVITGTLSGDTNTIKGNADIATGAALEFNQASDGTYSGSLSGNGTLVKSGSGILTLTSTGSTFTGANHITAGTLAGDTNTIKGNADIATGAALEFNQASDGTYAASLSGNGTLVKSGSGKLTLTNTGSTFAGVNNVTAGTLSGDTNTIRGNADIATGAALEFNQASNGTYSGSLSGNGTLVKSGSGKLILTNSGSTFAGVNNVTAGTLSGDTNTIRGNADIATGAALEFNQASNGTYSGSLSGNGTLVKSGSGKLILTNSGSTFAGVNNVTAGTLSGDTNTIRGNADIATGAALEFNQASDGTYSGSLSGNGTLVKSGSGILTLTSTGSTFTGANHITAGTLAGDTNTIKGNADIATGAALKFNQASDGTYSGSLSGNGTLVKSGSGKLILTSTGSAFTGANHITAGTLAGDVNTIKGSADIATGAAIEFNQTSDGTYTGSLSGNGTLVKSGSGKLTLTNIGSTFAGVNNVTAGTLSGDTNTIRGNADIATGAALEFNQASDGTYSGSLSGNGTLVKSGSGKLTLTNTGSTFAGVNNVTAGTLSGDTNTIRGSADIATGASLEFNQASDGTYSGSLSGNGTLVKSGSGILTLTSTGSTFTGANHITAGTLAGDVNTIKGNADIATGAALEFNQASDGTYSGSLSGNGTLVKSGSGKLTLTNTGSTFAGVNNVTAGTLSGDTNTIRGSADIATGASLEFNQASDGTYSGSLSGNGTLVKSGSGILTLTNTGSAFTGANHITAGTLVGDVNTIKGNADIATGASLEFNQASDGTYSGSLSGNGTLVKSGSGKLTLTSTGSAFTGANHITAGTLAGDVNTIKGNADIATGAAIEFNQASDGTYSGSLSGNGTLVKSGSHTLTITSIDSTFTGTSIVEAGKLKGDANTIKGNATVATGASLEFNQAVDGTYAGVLSGNGTFVKSGSGKLTFTNSGSTFAGANNVTAGTLSGDTNSIRGNTDIASGAALEFNQNSNGTYAGSLSGNGTLVKSGSHTLTITSIDSTFTGTSVVEAGKLKGNATTIKGNATVATGALLEFDQTTDGIYVGALSGDGTLVKSGSGTLALANTNNSFSGTNVITEGTLQGTTDTIKGDADIAATATLEFNQTVDGVYAGDLSGSGALVNSGSGVLTFTSSNTGYAGSASIATGIMRLDDHLALGSGPINNNAELELSFSGPFPNALSGTGSVTVNAADKTVEFTTEKTYTGATTVAAGTLKASTHNALTSSILLDIKSNATFAALAAQSIQDFCLAENASARFNHHNLTLEKGDIQGGLADVADLIKISPAELALHADVALGGNLSHREGGITIEEGKTVTVAGEANFAADTIFRVHPGEVAALRADAITFADTGPVIDLVGYSGTDSYVVAEAESGGIDANYQVMIGGSPVGTGLDLQAFALPNLVRQNDDHQLVATTALVWNNTNPASAHGVFDIPGSYMINSVLADNANPTAMYTEGSYAWDGKSLVKRGSGRLILGQRQAYTGLTTVEAGTLQLGLSSQREGGIASGGVTVKASGRLEGFGRVDGDVTIESGGRLMAGDGITSGIISVKNLGMLSGAGFIIPAAGGIHVDGHAHIDDAVEFTLQSADIASQTPRTLLNAGSLSGLTPDKEVELAFVSYILKQIETDGRVDLNLDVQEIRDLVGAAITSNQTGVATALDTWNGDDNQLREKIILLADSDEATQAFDLLGNELSATSRSHLLALNQQFWSYLSRSARTMRTADLPDISVSTGDAYAALSPDVRFSRGLFAWAQAGGAVMHTPQHANSARGKTTSHDFAVGIEGGSDNVRLGLVFRRADSRLEVDERLSHSDMDSHNLGIYAMTSLIKGPGRLLFSLGLSGGLHDSDSRREVAFSDYSERLAAHYRSKSAQGFLEAGYSLAPSTDSAIEPYANLTLNTLWNPTVTEDGGLASTQVESDRQCVLAAAVGGRFSYDISNWSCLDLDLAFRHTFGNVNPSSKMYFANDPGRNSFTTLGSGPTRDEAVLGVAYRVMPRDYLEFSFGYQAAFGEQSVYQRGTFTAGLLF